MARFLLPVVLTLYLCQVWSADPSSNAVQSLTRREFAAVKGRPDIQVVYFAQEPASDRSKDEAQSEDHTLKMFRREYENSAELLKQYNINLYQVDCSLEKIDDYCFQPKAYLQVFIFRDDLELLKIGVESMFDVDSIMSNVLQLALLREVPILQSRQERVEFENQSKGKNDVIFSFQNAIGTPEHRVFMEVAFAKHPDFKFAITTDNSAANDMPDFDPAESSAVWLLQCKSPKKSKACPPTKYYGPSTLTGLTEYLDNLDTKAIRELEGHKDEDPFSHSPLNTVYVFYDTESRTYVYNEAKLLTRRFRGNIGMLMVNVEKVDTEAMGFTVEGRIPVLAIRKKQTDTFIPMAMSEQPEQFITSYLKDVQAKSRTRRDGDSSVDRLQYLADVEKQDDDVALAIAKFTSKETNYDPIVTLTEKTLPEALNTRDVMMVMFHLPFDAVSTGAMYSYIQAADLYAADHKVTADTNPFGLLDCYSWPLVCSEYNVTSWPTIVVLRAGRQRKVHAGVLSPLAFIRAVQLYSLAAPAPVSSVQEVDSLLSQQMDLTVVGLAGGDEDAAVIRQAAEELHGEIPLSLASGDVAKAWASTTGVSLPRILITKPADQFQPRREVNVAGLSVGEVVQAVRDAARPAMVELSPANLPSLYAKKQPLAILFIDPSTDDKATVDILGNIAATGKYGALTFTWMDRSKKMTQTIMETYSGEHYDATFVVLDLELAQVFVYKGQLNNAGDIESWIEAVRNGDVDFSTELSRKEWKPHSPGFDFLKMIDEEEARLGQSKKAQRILEDIEDYDEAALDDEYLDDPLEFQAEYERHKSFQQDARHTEL